MPVFTFFCTKVNASDAPVVVHDAPTVFVTSYRLAQSAKLLTIKGERFDPAPAGNTVTFDVGWAGCGSNCQLFGVVTSATTTELQVALSIPPTARGPLTAEVTSFGKSSGPGAWVAYVVDPPTVTEASVVRAQNAKQLTIRGTGFEPAPNAARNTVEFNLGAVGEVTAASWDANTGAYELTVALSTPPTSKGALTAVVTSFGGSSGAPVQVANVVDPPRVAQSSDSVGISETSLPLVINGEGFDPVASGNSVELNFEATGEVTAATATSLTVRFVKKPNKSKGALKAVVTSFGGSSGDPVRVAFISDDYGR